MTATDTIAVALSKIENSISTISNAATKVVASNKNGYITVDGKDVKVYELKTDGTTIVTAEDGTIGVGAVTMDKVTGLNDKLTAIENGIPTYSIEKDADSGDYSVVYATKKQIVFDGSDILIVIFFGLLSLVIVFMLLYINSKLNVLSNALSDISNKIDISEENITNLEKSLDKSYVLCYINNGR